MVVIMFVDNASLLITAFSQEELLLGFKHVLNHMSQWFQANQLILKPTKLKV
jgi:hypothetical protein